MTARADIDPQYASLERRRLYGRLRLLLPAVTLLGLLFVVPLIGMAWRSVSGPDGLTLAHYQRFFGIAAYWRVLVITFEAAAVVTILTLLLGYPVAYLLNVASPRAARLLMIAVVLPFFTSIMVRTYAWIVLLGRQGVVNAWAQALGLVTRPLELLYNERAVWLGMTYVMLPYMILTLYSVMRGIDPTLVRAAQSLGAGGLEAFWRVFLPLSVPGIVSGALLVFILSLGFFITPALMGGPSDVLIAMLVEREIELTLNWGFGAAMAVVLLIATLGGFAIYYRVFGLRRILESPT